MSEIKIFRVMGTYVKNRKKYLFRKEVRALKEKDAVEKVLCEITSIGLLRRQVKIEEIKEIEPYEAENYLIRELSSQ
ncbi:MAG: 50S ribosomal protein L18Ae [Promethearchaeota archaeon]